MTTVTTPFNPLLFSSSLKDITCRDDTAAKYTEFLLTGPQRGISTGYTAGCNLRCVFCWIDESRDFPEKFGSYYSPEKAYEELLKTATMRGLKRLRLTGGEPTLCESHLIYLLDLAENDEIDSIVTLETNGILLGNDERYVEKLTKYKRLHVRVSFKAGTPERFQKITGVQSEFFSLPFKALAYLMKYRISCHASAMSDPKIMPPDEKSALLKQLDQIGYRDFLEEETCFPNPYTIRRLKEAGLTIFSHVKNQDVISQ